jgi:hypothetical protein
VPQLPEQIILETDLKNMNYRIVSSAKREYEMWRDHERAEETTEQRLDCFECKEEDAAGREG